MRYGKGMFLLLIAAVLDGQVRTLDPWLPRGQDTIDDFQSLCFGRSKTSPPETYWAAVCRFQRFEDGTWKVFTSASPMGPINRLYGPAPATAKFIWEDVEVFSLSLDIQLAGWGEIFMAPRDLDVQTAIARKIALGGGSGLYALLIETHDGTLQVSNFDGDNFGIGKVSNLVEIHFTPARALE